MDQSYDDFEDVAEEPSVLDAIDPLEALLNEETDLVPVKDLKVVTRTGQVIPWRIRQLDNVTYKRLQKRATKQVRNKRGQRETEFDTDLFQALLIHAATVSPDLHDSRLLQKYGVPVSEELIDRILAVGQRTYVADEVLTLMGFLDDLVEQAKN